MLCGGTWCLGGHDVVWGDIVFGGNMVLGNIVWAVF